MSKDLLEEIENWKLEAKLEDTTRYFYHTRVVERIISGKKLYVVGRKGTGKTAISEHLIQVVQDNYFSQKLTFKNFPFNELYNLNDKGFTSPNQYITLWKYVIYSTTCRLMIGNQNIDSEIRKKLAGFFDEDIESALPHAVKKWTSAKFDLKVLDYGFSAGGSRNYEVLENSNWIDRVGILEKFLQKHIQHDKYIVMFDELDEDYKDILDPTKYKQYTELLTSLFKAAQDIRARFSSFKLYPVIFIRDDIYDVLQDPDKTKWIDYKVDLEWDQDAIKNLLAFRISRAINPYGKMMDFSHAWHMLFSQGEVMVGHQKKGRMLPFDYISRSTLNRPRDFIRYLQVCADLSIEKGFFKIKPFIVSEADKSFSNYLRSELEDELHGTVPDIKRILDIFTTLRKQTLRIEEFNEAFDAAVKNQLIKTKDFQFVCQLLFHFSIIGNQPKQESHQIFRYKNKEARLNMKENIILHRGLFRALQIL